MDVLKMLKEKGFEPEVVLDDSGIDLITGKYVARIDEVARITGNSKSTGEPFDFRSMNLQVVEIVDGDKAMNRYVKKTYNPDEVGMSKLLNDLFTAGITLSASNDEELDQELATLKDKTVNVRCWGWKNRKSKEGKELKDLQMVKIVKEFGAKKKTEGSSTSVPF